MTRMNRRVFLQTSVCAVSAVVAVWGTVSFAAAQNAPGRLDTTFVPQGLSAGDSIRKILVQPDDKIVIIDTSLHMAATNHYVRRLNTDGSTDSSFSVPEFTGTQWPPPGSALAWQRDRILVGGNFTTFNGSPAKGIARLNGFPKHLSIGKLLHISAGDLG